MKIYSALILAAVSAIAIAQGAKDGLKHPGAASVPAKDAGSPVTRSEAAAVFAKAESVMRAVLAIKTPSQHSIASGAVPVTRAQIVQEMNRLYDLARPAFKLSLRSVKYDPGVLSMKDAQAKAELNKLVRVGCIARVGPLATSPKDSITLPQFGDALGFFLLRISELTHTPSTKWSPYLQPNG